MTNKRTILLFSMVLAVLFASFSLTAQSVSAQDAAQVRSDFVEAAKKNAGAPYEFGAIGPDSFDCSGFIFTVARESTGVQLPRTVKALYSFVQVIPQNQLEPGDIVFFRTTGDGTISHAGIYIGNTQFMHAVSDGPNTGVIISSLKEATWKKAYAGSGRFLPSGQYSDPINEAAINAAVAATGTAAEIAAVETGASVSGTGAETTPSTAISDAEVAAAKTKAKKAAGKTTETTPANSKAENTASKPAKKNTSSSKPKKNAPAFANKLVFDASLSADWSFFTAKRGNLNFRGVPVMANLSRTDWPLNPGIYSGFRFNTGVSAIQIPLALSITPNDYFRCYAGPMITAGSPELPGDKDVDIKASVFPGIIGFSWNTPSFTKGKVKVALCQDVSYTVFNKTDGSALSAKNSFASGLLFTTGVRVTLPFSMFF